jgi:uncharacterized membrane protein
MTARLLALTVLAALLTAPSMAAQRIITLPEGTWANDITPDGEIVVGTAFTGGFVWRWRVDPGPTYMTGITDIVAVSDDGSVLAGNMIDPLGSGATVAARWTESTGWVSLGGLPGGLACPSISNAYDMSGDGSTIVGLSWQGCNGRGFLWTEATGMQELMNLGNGNCRASAISGDGSAIGGFAQGSFSRTPALWNADTTGSMIDFNDLGEVFGFNDDGSTAVGGYDFGTGFFLRAFTRTGGVMTDLGNLNPDWNSHAVDISEDGGLVVGYDTISLSREAWVWTAATGIVALNDVLTSIGVTDAPPLLVCRKTSSDGNLVVGGYSTGVGPFSYGGFIVEFNTDEPWTNLGGGTPGIAGTPELSGNGSLVGGTTAGLDLVNAPPSALMLAWLSFTSSPANFFGGTVHATPFDAQFLFSSSPAGTFSASTTWPVGVPTGTDVWFQFILSDPSVLWGLALSHGLTATAP